MRTALYIFFGALQVAAITFVVWFFMTRQNPAPVAAPQTPATPKTSTPDTVVIDHRPITVPPPKDYGVDPVRAVTDQKHGENQPDTAVKTPIPDPPQHVRKARQPGELVKVAIVGFALRGDLAGQDKQIPDSLADGLESKVDLKLFDLYERRDMDGLKKEQVLAKSDISAGDAAALGKRFEDIDWLCIGTLGRVGTSYILSAKLVDPWTGQIHGHGSVDFATLDNVRRFDLITKLANELGLTQKPPVAAEIVGTGDMTEVVNPQANFSVQLDTGDGRGIYQDGDPISFAVTASKDCYVVLVQKDPAGEVTMLLPNGWRPRATKVRAGVKQKVGVEPDSFRYNAQGPAFGESVVKAICTERPLKLDEAVIQQLKHKVFPSFAKGAAPPMPKSIGTHGADGSKVPPQTEQVLDDASTWATAEISIIVKPAQGGVVAPHPVPTAVGDANELMLQRWGELTRGNVHVSSALLHTADISSTDTDEWLIVRRGPAAGLKGIGGNDSLLDQMEVYPPPGSKAVGDNPNVRLQQFRADPDVVAVVPNCRLRLFDARPTKLMPVQWGLYNDVIAGVDAGWNPIAAQARGINPPLIGLVDSGLSMDDPRVASIAWTTPGFNFVKNNATLFDPGEKYSHGSMCATIIGGHVTGNPDDVMGVAPNAKIICGVALTVPDDDGKTHGGGDLKTILTALAYVCDQGAKVVNLSFGGEVTPEQLAKINQLPIWGKLEEKGIILVCAAGNEARDNDAKPVFPASLPRKNIVSVLAVDANGRLGRAKDSGGQWRIFSNYGAKTVHIGAPGSLILGVPQKDGIKLDCGTSFAAPMVTGVIALVMGQHPDWDYQTVIRAVMESSTPCEDLKGKCQTGGIVNAAAALAWKKP